MNLETLLAPISDDLDRVATLMRKRLMSDVAMIDQIGGYIVSAGGKRLRPAVVLLAARALGCASDEPALLAAIVEIIHTATLLHDDVVDGADLRRGKKTANAVWGNPGTVLSGDFLYSRSFQMMVDDGRMAIMRVLADTTNAIAQGEVMQLMNCGDPNVSEERYLNVIDLKTARLFQAAARLGAIAADRDAATQDRLGAYGQSLGMAYQLIDDLLDYTAAPEVSGKNLGTDLADGKPTLPLIYTMKNGTPEQAELIRRSVRQGRLENLKDVLAAVESTQAIPYTAALAARHARAAAEALGDVPDSPCKHSLLGLARFAVERTH